MPKLDFLQLKKRFEKSYPVFIALTSSILSFFSFLFQFHDSFKGWNIILVALVIFMLSILCSCVLIYGLYSVVKRNTISLTKGPYTVVESHDSCEFSDKGFGRAKYRRTEKIKIHVNAQIAIFYRLPTINTGRIENITCTVNNDPIQYHKETVHSDSYCLHTHDPKLGTEIIRVWEWDAIGVYENEDDVKITSSPMLEKCILKIIIPYPSKKLKAESYVYIYHSHTATARDNFNIPVAEEVSIIEYDFSPHLDGGIYKFGLHWKVNES